MAGACSESCVEDRMEGGGFLFHFLYEGPVKWLFVRPLGSVAQEKHGTAGCGFRSGCPLAPPQRVVTQWITPRSLVSHTHDACRPGHAHAAGLPSTCTNNLFLSLSISLCHALAVSHWNIFFQLKWRQRASIVFSKSSSYVTSGLDCGGISFIATHCGRIVITLAPL